MILTAIAAMASNRTIGVDNDLPWNLPEDLQFFKTKTKASVLIMGRKTFESLKKPLPGRFHIVITRNAGYEYSHERVIVVPSVETAIDAAKNLIPAWPEEVFIVGGGEIYHQCLEKTDRIYLTRIEREYAGHAHFPEFENSGDFRLVQVTPASTNGSVEMPSYQFETWERRS